MNLENIFQKNFLFLIAKDNNTIDSATQQIDPTRTTLQDSDKNYKEIQVKQDSYQHSFTATVN